MTAVFAGANKLVEAVYELPYLAHAAMEPLNCVAQISKDGCELWYGAQSLSSDQAKVAALLAITPDKVKINQLFAGGSFGRRADLSAGYVLETVRIAKALGDGQPLKLQWTREDDMRGGLYRPAATHALRGAVASDGRVLAWQQRIVSRSLWGGDGMRAGKLDKTIHEGASDLPYRIANLAVEAHVPELAVPVLWWRSVGHTHTAFAVECFIDDGGGRLRRGRQSRCGKSADGRRHSPMPCSRRPVNAGGACRSKHALRRSYRSDAGNVRRDADAAPRRRSRRYPTTTPHSAAARPGR